MNIINRNKASDIFKIKPTIIRDLTPFLAPVLTRLFNQTIAEHDYPDALKLTKVIELFKKKDRTLPKFYRPISLLPILAKLLDTLINNQLMQHLTTQNIIYPTQYAFRPNSNTTLALQTIIDQLHRHIKQKQPTLAVYVDLSKAYDTVCHSKLLHKLLHNFNFTEPTVAFFASYFRNTTRTIDHADHHPWHPPRQHPLHNILPPLHQRHHQDSPRLNSIHIRRRHHPRTHGFQLQFQV